MISSYRKVLLIAATACCSYYHSFAQPGISGIPDRSKDAAALYVDAVKARMLEDAKQEESLLKEVVKLNPDEAAPYQDLAKLYQKQRKYDQAEQEIRRAIDINKDNIWYRVSYAEILEAQNKIEEAAAVYKELASREKYNTDYILRSANLYESAGKYKEAITMYNQLEQKLSSDDERLNFVLYQEQQLYLKANDLPNALKIAEQFIKKNPGDGKAYSNLAELYSKTSQPEKAADIYEQALKLTPDDPALQFSVAQFYKNQKNVAKYEEYVRKAILNPDFDDETQVSVLLTYLQELATDSTRKKESINITQQLVQLHPQNPQIVNIYGEVLLDNGEPQKAQEQFKTAVTLDPSRFVAWQRLLFSYTDRKDADSLIRYSEKAMRYFPNQAMVHYLNGIGYYNKKSYTPALKSLNRAVDLQPEDNKALLADMYSTLGDVYNAAGKSTASDSAYDKALALAPDNASVLNNYAYYLSERGLRLSDAERMSKKSLELRPEEATFLDTYGWILYKQGNYQKAKDSVEKALEKNPDADGTLYDHLGDIYYKLNNTDKAVEYWKKAKEKGTDNVQIDKKIQDKKLYE